MQNNLVFSEALRMYIETLAEEVVLKGSSFNDQKKWLQRYCEMEGVDYATLEKNLMDFFEVMEEWKQHRLKSSELMAKMLAEECGLSDNLVENLCLATIKSGPEIKQSAKETTHPSTEKAKDKILSFRATLERFNMVRVEGGTFQMGSNAINASDDEKPVHKVALDTFYIGETLVTQKLWNDVMGDNPSYFNDDEDQPVECVSWEACQEFIQELNRLTDKHFRLPTEAEWEYAAKGGNKSRGYRFAGSDDCGEVACYMANSGADELDEDDFKDCIVGAADLESDYYCGTMPVKCYEPNELGLYDMTGNVWEWCADEWYDYDSNAQRNPKHGGLAPGKKRVLRGGSWSSFSSDCRVTCRIDADSDEEEWYYGFRLALSEE